MSDEKHYPEEWTDRHGVKQFTCICGDPWPCPKFIPGKIKESSIKPPENITTIVAEWCDKVEKAIADGQGFDTFTQIFYDRFVKHLKRENRR